MSYHIYTTKGIILSTKPYQEADRVYKILTREFGLIYATATGVRRAESKLRGSLEPLRISSISLVRGKEFWRITSAESLGPISQSVSTLRPLSLLEKLVQGEEPHPELFDAIESMLLTSEDSDTEVSLASKILYHLGYLKESDLQLGKDKLVQAINDGLRVSHLV